MLGTLNAEDRMRLMKFLCAMAWVDGEVHHAERDLVTRLMKTLELEADEMSQVEAWLAEPPAGGAPPLEELPAEQRQLFFQQALDLVAADGELKPQELDRISRMLRAIGDAGGSAST